MARFYTPSLSCVSLCASALPRFRASCWPAGRASGTGFCIDRKRVFRLFYTRHVNTRKPVSMAVSAVAYKRVRFRLQRKRQ
jgi:hypothetical protein